MNKPKFVCGYDFDGVVSIGVRPTHDGLIITGRCVDEQDYVKTFCSDNFIENDIYFNPMTLQERGNHTVESRIYSAKHKANTILELRKKDIHVVRFFEDDEIQKGVIDEILKVNGVTIDIVHVVSNLVTK